MCKLKSHIILESSFFVCRVDKLSLTSNSTKSQSHSSHGSESSTIAIVNSQLSANAIDTDERKVFVYVRLVENDVVAIAHHYIVIYMKELGMHELFEWTNNGLMKSTIESLCDVQCLSLGAFTIKQVEEAVDTAANNRQYNVTTFNCNHWTERVARALGKYIEVNAYCSEIIDDARAKECHYC